MSIESVMLSNRLILCCPLLLLHSVFPSIRSFPRSQLFAPSGQSIGVLASASRVFSNTTIRKHQFFGAQSSLWFSSHIHTWLLEKPWLWLYGFVSEVKSLLFNTLSRFVIAFLPRTKCLLILCLRSLSTVILEPKKVKSVTASTFPLFAWKWQDWMPWS